MIISKMLLPDRKNFSYLELIKIYFFSKAFILDMVVVIQTDISATTDFSSWNLRQTLCKTVSTCWRNNAIAIMPRDLINIRNAMGFDMLSLCSLEADNCNGKVVGILSNLFCVQLSYLKS